MYKWKILKTIVLIVAVIALMFGEYKYIILNIKPYIVETDEYGGYIDIEFGGRVDEYYAPRIDDNTNN